MRVGFIPFCSQQNKVTGQFRLQSDSGVKLYAALAKEAVAAGWTVRTLLPNERQCEDCVELAGDTVRYVYAVPTCNLERRLHWDMHKLKSFSQDLDVIVTTNIPYAIPLSTVAPKVNVVVEKGFHEDAMHSLFELALDHADMVHCVTNNLAKHACVAYRTTVWPLAYNDEEAAPRDLYRGIDVLFPARCSVVDYTGYKYFMEAMRPVDATIRMTDPTSYLRSQGGSLYLTPPLSREAYTSLLHSSKVVVGLSTNGSGGMALREAAACGATPVTLRLPEYIEVLGEDWPYYCELEPYSIRTMVLQALANPRDASKLPGVLACSRTAVWKQAKADLEALCS